MKWLGFYEHNAKDGHFMLRTKIPQGILTAEQAEAIAWIASEHGRDTIDSTTRQCVQIHWIALPAMPEILAALERVGLTSIGACGDVTRNVIGCPVAGIAHDEIVDGRATALAIHRHLLGNRAFSNLPRKYKISVTGCRQDCAHGAINDVALSGAVHEDGTRGFNLRVGGGLSATPRFARWIDAFISPEEAIEVVEQITAIFHDAQENRRARGKARLKFLLDRVGPDGFRDQLQQRLGRPLRQAAPHRADAQVHDHVGVTRQRDGAHSAIGLCVPLGRLSAEHFRQAVELARRYGTGELRLTHQQNILIPQVPDGDVDALLADALIREHLSADPSLFTRGVQTCTGKQFCGLAKVHTKDRAADLVSYLDQHVAPNGHGHDLRIHFAGCSSGCAQDKIADIGIEGVLKRVDGELIEAMDIRIGGRLGSDPRFAALVARKVPHHQLNQTVLKILELYERNHRPGETFRAFADRIPPQWWECRLDTTTEASGAEVSTVPVG
jgi:ferredoxin-nitrite reductase